MRIFTTKSGWHNSFSSAKQFCYKLHRIFIFLQARRVIFPLSYCFLCLRITIITITITVMLPSVWPSLVLLAFTQTNCHYCHWEVYILMMWKYSIVGNIPVATANHEFVLIFFIACFSWCSLLHLWLIFQVIVVLKVKVSELK